MNTPNAERERLDPHRLHRICEILRSHDPCAKPLTAKQINRQLGEPLSIRQTQKYITAIYSGARGAPDSASGALQPPATVAHADTHGSSSPVTTPDVAAPVVLARRDGGHDGPVPKLALSADVRGGAGDRAARPAAVGASRGSVTPRVPDRLEGFVARDIRERRFIEPDYC